MNFVTLSAVEMFGKTKRLRYSVQSETRIGNKKLNYDHITEFD